MARTIQTLTVRIGSDISDAINGLDAVGVKAHKMGRKMQWTGRTLTRNVTLPLTALGAASFKVASDFEASLGKIEGLVGVQREQIEAWRGDIRSLAVDYGKSATEAADAMFFITSAGLEGSDALDVLDASLKASASGLGETKTVADLATSAMNAYGSEVLSATEATDVLTAAVREGKLEPAELGSAMAGVLPVASAMGIEFKEVGAAMASMSRTGTTASEASTQLRSIMTSLLKPTADSRKALAEVGLSAQGLREQIKEEGLLSAFRTLNDRLAGNEEITARAFGNKRALVGVMDLLGDSTEKTAAIFDSLEDTSGDLDSAFEKQKNAGLALNQVIAASKDLFLEIGDAILPMATTALEKIRDILKGVTEAIGRMEPAMQKVVLAVSALTAAAGPALIAIGSMLKVFGFILAPIGATIAILGTLTFTIGVLAANWKALKVRTTLVWTAIKSAVFSAVDGILGALEKMAGWIPGIGDKIKSLRSDFDAFAEESLANSGRKLAELEADLSAAGAEMNEFGDATTETADEVAPEGGGGSLGRIREATADITREVVGATAGIREFKAETIEAGEMNLEFVGEAEEKYSELEGALDGMGERGLDAVTDFAKGSEDAISSFVDSAVKEVTRLIGKFLVLKTLQLAAPGLASTLGIAGGATGRRHGGNVMRGQSYWVGEQGAERFVPQQPGRIVPASDAGGGGAGALASEIMDRVGPPPGPTSPEVAATHDYYRRLFSEMVKDGKDRGVRFD